MISSRGSSSRLSILLDEEMRCAKASFRTPRLHLGLHLPLRVARVALRLLLLLLVLLVGAVMAIETACGRAECAVVTGNMAGDAADDRTLDAASGVGRCGRGQSQRGNGQNGKCGFHDAFLHDGLRIINGRPRAEVPAMNRFQSKSIKWWPSLLPIDLDRPVDSECWPRESKNNKQTSPEPKWSRL